MGAVTRSLQAQVLWTACNQGFYQTLSLKTAHHGAHAFQAKTIPILGLTPSGSLLVLARVHVRAHLAKQAASVPPLATQPQCAAGLALHDKSAHGRRDGVKGLGAPVSGMCQYGRWFAVRFVIDVWLLTLFCNFKHWSELRCSGISLPCVLMAWLQKWKRLPAKEGSRARQWRRPASPYTHVCACGT